MESNENFNVICRSQDPEPYVPPSFAIVPIGEWFSGRPHMISTENHEIVGKYTILIYY